MCTNVNITKERRQLLLKQFVSIEEDLSVIQYKYMDIKKQLDQANKDLKEATDKLQQYNYHE